MKIVLAFLVLFSCTHRPTTQVVETEEKQLPGSFGVFKAQKDLQWLKDLERVANCVKQRNELYEEIENSAFMLNNGKTSKQIADELRAGSFKIDTYSKVNPWSKTIATYSGETILLRSQMHPRKMEEMIETVFHEPMHILKYYHAGNYNNEENRKTVPYKVGEIARKYVEGCK